MFIILLTFVYYEWKAISYLEEKKSRIILCLGFHNIELSYYMFSGINHLRKEHFCGMKFSVTTRRKAGKTQNEQVEKAV